MQWPFAWKDSSPARVPANFHRRDTWAKEVKPRWATRARPARPRRHSRPMGRRGGSGRSLRYALATSQKASESLGLGSVSGIARCRGECSRASRKKWGEFRQCPVSAVGRARRRRVSGARRPAGGFGTRTGVCSRPKRKLFGTPEMPVRECSCSRCCLRWIRHRT